MVITNKHGLPESIVNAIQAFQTNYEKSKSGKEQFSATELLKPSGQRFLQKMHNHQLTEDASERIWALIGQATHSILASQNIDNSIIEKRLYHDFDNVTISGQMDKYYNGIIEDYKICSVQKWINRDFSEYGKQLNIYAWLARMNGYEVKEIKAILIFRDYSKSKAKHSAEYPQQPVKQITFDLWDIKKAEEFISDRIEAHRYPEVCTKEERWAQPTKYAVIKNNNKRATKLCETHEEAQDYIKTLDPKHKYKIEVREGFNARCDDYCRVNKYCTFYQKLKEDK